jgi:hypothetical protein
VLNVRVDVYVKVEVRNARVCAYVEVKNLRVDVYVEVKNPRVCVYVEARNAKVCVYVEVKNPRVDVEVRNVRVEDAEVNEMGAAMDAVMEEKMKWTVVE